jgi:hypothetical protein
VNTDYVVINLRDAIDELREERVSEILSSFSCDLNTDIENFIRQDAIRFSNQGIAQTHLVMGEVNSRIELFAYFVLTNKVLAISPDNVSKTFMKKIAKFGVPDQGTGTYNIPLPLIAQLGKNYADHLDRYISGDLLLEIACGKVAAIQRELGGKLVYIECENNPNLIDFYISNQFRDISGNKPNTANDLLQMIRYL